MRPDDGRQLGFWGNDAAADTRAARALARVQGLLGPGAALTAVLQGGRDYTEQVLLVPWGEPRVPMRPGAPAGSTGKGPSRLGPGRYFKGPSLARSSFPVRTGQTRAGQRRNTTVARASPWPGAGGRPPATIAGAGDGRVGRPGKCREPVGRPVPVPPGSRSGAVSRWPLAPGPALGRSKNAGGTREDDGGHVFRCARSKVPPTSWPARGGDGGWRR